MKTVLRFCSATEILITLPKGSVKIPKLILTVSLPFPNHLNTCIFIKTSMKHESTDTHLLSFKIKAGRENNKAPTAETLGKIQ